VRGHMDKTTEDEPDTMDCPVCGAARVELRPGARCPRECGFYWQESPRGVRAALERSGPECPVCHARLPGDEGTCACGRYRWRLVVEFFHHGQWHPETVVGGSQ